MISNLCFHRSFCPKEGDETVMKNVGERTSVCLEQKKFKLYSARIEITEIANEDEGFYVDSMNTNFMFRFSSKKRIVHEEILILDEIGLIGSLGGSLGLFVGFSFFGYVMPLVEALFDKFVDFFQRRYQVQEVHNI